MVEKFQHKKSLGQHFLTSDYVPKKMCDAADLQAGEVVLEIGPGTGVLTREILARGAQVVAVEADERAIAALEETFPHEITAKQLIIHHADARSLTFADLGAVDREFKVIANIPYYLSGLLFRTCLESTIQPRTLVFLVQKEVAERIARSKKESILSLSVKVFGDPTYICTVKRSHFTPPPAVDSAVIAVNNINKDNFTNISPETYFEILHVAFGQKRKQLKGNLRKQYSAQKLDDIFEKLALAPDVRAEDLLPTEFLQLVSELS